MQSYIANQPYFNQFTGKGLTSPSINRPMSRFSSLTSSEADRFNRYYNTFPAVSTWGLDVDNRLDLITKQQNEKPVSRQMETKKMSPVLMSGIIPLSTARNIRIIRPYGSDKFVISRSNSYLFHNRFPLEISNFLRRNNNKGTSFSFYSKPFTQNAILTNPLLYYHKKRTYSVTAQPAEEASPRNRFTSVSQTNAFASSIALYENHYKVTSSSPFVNGYFKNSTFSNDGITHSFHNTDTGQELSTNPYSYFRRPVKPTPSDNFQLTNVANDSTLRSSLNSAVYPWPTLLRKGGKISSAEDKVVTEGELKEKGLLSDILSRDHIRRKPGNVRKEQLRK